MTIKELTETINNYDDIEVYYPLSTGRHFSIILKTKLVLTKQTRICIIF